MVLPRIPSKQFGGEPTGDAMAIDLTGGLGDDREYVFATQPDEPDMRESVNTWVWDNGTEFGMPRIGVEAVADQWDTHDVQVNLAFADGRVFNIFGPGKVHDARGADGKPAHSRSS
jgi:prepilin-type processing-associated H-X9-DG protein